MGHDFKRFPELTNNQMQFYYFESPHKQIDEDFLAKVIKVTDGDTILVRWQERDFDFPVRLANIQAPELKEGGITSKKWLESKINNQEVEILINPYNRVGKWGRILGEVLFRGVNLNEESLDMQMSIPFGEEF